MVTSVTDPTEINKIRAEQQTLEQELSRDLYNVFNTGFAIANLRTVVHAGLIDMRNGDPRVAANVIKAENYLDVVTKHADGAPHTIETIDHLLASIDDFDASDCSDTIRLIGAWIEKSEGEQFSVQNAYRPGVVHESPSKAATGWAGEHWNREVAAVWAGGRRERGKNTAGIPAHITPAGPASTGGIQLKQAWKTSTVLKLDRLFGLFAGADISGTTADSTFIVERWGADLLHPVYYLLPAATLVFNRHHTLIEVALVLSLNSIIDYRVGVYSSLMPSQSKSLPSELANVPTILEEAQHSPRNHHCIFFYDDKTSDSQPQPAGGLLFDDDETKLITDEQGTFFCATEALALAQNYSPFPTQDEAVDLIQRTAPALFSRLPAGIKPDPYRSTG